MSNRFKQEVTRILWADIAKGIGIILVVIAHTPIPIVISDNLGIPNFFQNWIYAFHMPFFFLISGFLTNWKSSHSSFAIRKTKTLLFLFVVYSIINIFLAFGAHRFMLILKAGWGGQALWFLPILFLSLVIAKLFSDKIIVVGIFVMLLLSWLLAINHVHWRWALASVPYATMWILIGRLSTRFINEILKRSRLERAIYSFCFLVIVSVVAYNYRLDICGNRILPLIPLVISGISGSLMVIIVAAYIAKLRFFNGFLGSFGRNSLEIMAFHQSILYFIPVPIAIRIVLLPVITIFIVSLRRKVIKLTQSHRKKEETK